MKPLSKKDILCVKCLSLVMSVKVLRTYADLAPRSVRGDASGRAPSVLLLSTSELSQFVPAFCKAGPSFVSCSSSLHVFFAAWRQARPSRSFQITGSKSLVEDVEALDVIQNLRAVLDCFLVLNDSCHRSRIGRVASVTSKFTLISLLSAAWSAPWCRGGSPNTLIEFNVCSRSTI